MQGIIDATCRDCSKVIRWDTMLPRLCGECWENLRKPEPPQSEPEDEEVEVPA